MIHMTNYLLMVLRQAQLYAMDRKHIFLIVKHEKHCGSLKEKGVKQFGRPQGQYDGEFDMVQ
jgi:hypothetical protein